MVTGPAPPQPGLAQAPGWHRFLLLPCVQYNLRGSQSLGRGLGHCSPSLLTHIASQAHSLSLSPWLSPNSTEFLASLPQGQTPQHLCLISTSSLRLPGPRQAPAGPGTRREAVSKGIQPFPWGPQSLTLTLPLPQDRAANGQPSPGFTSLGDCWVLGGMEEFGELDNDWVCY